LNLSPPLDSFTRLDPETIMTAAETCGDRATGRMFALNAMENRVYDVELENSRVVVKFYRPARWDEPTLRTEHAFLRAATEDGIPVVAPLSRADGETLFRHEHMFYAVFPRRGGRLEAELNKTQLTTLGHTLARLHNVASRVTNPCRPRLNPDFFITDAWDLITSRRLIGPLWEQRIHPMITRVHELAGRWLENARMTLIHGDCHVGNILWRETDPMVIDFDDCLMGPAVQDFWMLTGGDDEDSLRRRDTLIDAYTELRDFDFDELHLIELLRTMRIIRYSGWIAQRWDDQSFKRMFPHFGTDQWWQEQTETLSVQLEKMVAATFS
jgi:Ser/Thr protein kinase RdoA (MazF antagonist)